MQQVETIYSQDPQNEHTKIQIQKDDQYYKKKCRALKQKLQQFENENEQLIIENQTLLDQNLTYTDTISSISKSTLDSTNKLNVPKRLEQDYQNLIKHTKRLNLEMRHMVQKVKKADEIILALKRTGNPTISDLIDSLDQKTNRIYDLENQLSQIKQSENFAKEDLSKKTINQKQIQEENIQLRQLLDSIKSHHQTVTDNQNHIIKQQRSEINELNSKSLLLESCARNSQKMNQKAVEDSVENKQLLNKKLQQFEQQNLDLQNIKESHIAYQIQNPSCQPVEIKRQRNFVLY